MCDLYKSINISENAVFDTLESSAFSLIVAMYGPFCLNLFLFLLWFWTVCSLFVFRPLFHLVNMKSQGGKIKRFDREWNVFCSAILYSTSFRYNLQHYPRTTKMQNFNCACGFIGKSAFIKYHQLLTKVVSIHEKSLFDQLTTASSFIHP